MCMYFSSLLNLPLSQPPFLHPPSLPPSLPPSFLLSSCTYQATGIRIGVLFQILFGFLSAIIISFIAAWELTLVVIVVFPVLGAVTFMQQELIVGRIQRNKKSLEKSGETAVESIENIRTVAGLGIEEKFIDQYVGLLKGPFE